MTLQTKEPNLEVDAVLSGQDGLVEEMKTSILCHLRLTMARHLSNATRRELWMATSLAVRDQLIDRFIETQAVHSKAGTKRVYYLSLEYLMGRLLNVNLHNCGLREPVRQALSELDQDLEELCEEEHDMGLGNGHSEVTVSVQPLPPRWSMLPPLGRTDAPSSMMTAPSPPAEN